MEKLSVNVDISLDLEISIAEGKFSTTLKVIVNFFVPWMKFFNEKKKKKEKSSLYGSIIRERENKSYKFPIAIDRLCEVVVFVV